MPKPELAAKNTKVTFSTFEITDHLDSENVIAEYLSVAARDENSDVLLIALSDAAKARGMARVAKDAGLGRESPYKALRQSSKPQFSTIAAVMRALNMKIEVAAK
jgi:probable addiction module antidote protein